MDVKQTLIDGFANDVKRYGDYRLIAKMFKDTIKEPGDYSDIMSKRYEQCAEQLLKNLTTFYATALDS